MKKTHLLLIIIGTLLMLSCKKEKCDLIIHNANIYLIDSTFSTASALAIKDGKITASGTNDEIFKKYESSKQLDLKNNYVYPGFIDAHSHFTGQAELMYRYADLKNTKSYSEVIARLKTHEKLSKDSWICGRGWDQNDWEGQPWPDKAELDELWPDKPVYLVRIDGHAAVVNSKALELAGINKSTEIDGGSFLKNNGILNGVLIDNAMTAVRNLIPELTIEQKTEALKLAEKACISKGLTMVSDAGLNKADVLLIDSLQKNNGLNIRINTMLNPTKENIEHFIKKGPLKTDKLSIGSIKLFSDGALGSRGACLLENYSDDPNNTGFILEPKSFYEENCSIAAKYGYQVCTHCIGDSAIRFMLDVYSEFINKKSDHRWRIEHAQIVNPNDMNSFGELGVIPSIQTTHCTSDMDWAESRLGKNRIKSAYAYQELVKQNGWIINGTDFPIEEINPLFTFYSAVFRTHHDGTPKGGFQLENALNRQEALRSITIWAAKGSFDELTRGSLEAGKFADFVILDTDLMSASPEDIINANVIGTFIDGEKQY